MIWSVDINNCSFCYFFLTPLANLCCNNLCLFENAVNVGKRIAHCLLFKLLDILMHFGVESFIYPSQCTVVTFLFLNFPQFLIKLIPLIPSRKLNIKIKKRFNYESFFNVFFTDRYVNPKLITKPITTPIINAAVNSVSATLLFSNWTIIVPAPYPIQ